MSYKDDPSLRAVRAVMGWHGDDVSSLADALGIKRSTLSERIRRGLRSQDLRQIGEHYGVDPMDLARGIVPRLTAGSLTTGGYDHLLAAAV